MPTSSQIITLPVDSTCIAPALSSQEYFSLVRHSGVKRHNWRALGAAVAIVMLGVTAVAVARADDAPTPQHAVKASLSALTFTAPVRAVSGHVQVCSVRHGQVTDCGAPRPLVARADKAAR